jgi:hypothetical protein
MMSMVGAAVAPDTAAAPVLGDDPLDGGKGFDRRRWSWNASGLTRLTGGAARGWRGADRWRPPGNGVREQAGAGPGAGTTDQDPAQPELKHAQSGPGAQAIDA